MENKIQEVTKQEYIELFKWLFGSNIQIVQEQDITLAHDYEDINIYYTKEIYELFNTNSMQRLGKILHLGSLIYSNENSYFTRLEHSKQAYYRCIEFLALKARDSEWKKYIEDTNQKGYLVEKIKFMCVHDIGHSMFSHSMERTLGDTHEKIGKKIIQEDDETREILDRIRADESKSNLKGDGSLELFCEGNIDFDRMAYLPTDIIFTGKKHTNDLILRLQSMCHLKQVSKNREMKYVYESKALEDIIEFIKIRDKMYKESYYNKQSKWADSILNTVCEKAINGGINFSEKFKQLVNKIVNKKASELDINSYLQTNDMFFLNELIKYKFDNKDNEELVSILIPSKTALLQIAINMIDLKNRESKSYTEEEKEFICNVKRIIKEEDSIETPIYSIEYTEDKRDDISKELYKIFGTEEIPGISFYERKYRKYNKNEPIYVQHPDGKIYTLDKYPDISIDLETQTQYGVYINKIELREQGIEQEKIEQFIQITKEKLNSNNLENNQDIINRMSMFQTGTTNLLNKANQFFDEER